MTFELVCRPDCHAAFRYPAQCGVAVPGGTLSSRSTGLPCSAVCTKNQPGRPNRMPIHGADWTVRNQPLFLFQSVLPPSQDPQRYEAKHNYTPCHTNPRRHRRMPGAKHHENPCVFGLEIGLPGQIWPDCYREGTAIGPPAGRKLAGGRFQCFPPVAIRPKSGQECRFTDREQFPSWRNISCHTDIKGNGILNI
jgi:hypothetical protein